MGAVWSSLLPSPSLGQPEARRPIIFLSLLPAAGFKVHPNGPLLVPRIHNPVAYPVSSTGSPQPPAKQPAGVLQFCANPRPSSPRTGTARLPQTDAQSSSHISKACKKLGRKATTQPPTERSLPLSLLRSKYGLQRESKRGTPENNRLHMKKNNNLQL